MRKKTRRGRCTAAFRPARRKASRSRPNSKSRDGKLQLSIYTMKEDGFSEVVINPTGGKVDKAETITDKEDLEHATAQKAAMDKAKITLLAAPTALQLHPSTAGEPQR
jgi:hypothetical protein